MSNFAQPSSTAQDHAPNMGLPLATLPLDSSKPPKERLTNATDAQTLVQVLWNANLKRMRFNAAIQGQFDGNPPYLPSQMRAQGRASDPNFNTLEAKALRATSLVPYYDLFCGDNRYVDMRTEFGDDRMKQRWSDIISNRYDQYILREWRGYDIVMQQMLCEFVGFGKGFMEWRDCYSWRARKISYNRVLVPDDTPIDIEDDELDCIVVLQDWTVTSLYERVRNDGAAKEAGWNPEEVYKVLRQAMPRNPNNPFDPVSVQRALHDNDMYTSARTSKVQTAAIYVREFDGKWSHLIVPRNTQAGGTPGDTGAIESPGFLFEARSRYDCLTDFLVPFFYDAGATTWNGASGIGKDIFAAMQLKDRLACALAMSVFLRASIVLQPKTALDKTRMNSIQLGAITYIPEGMEVHQSTILGDITSNIEVSRELDRTIERNTGVYRPTIDKTSGNPQTLGEFETKFAQATALSTSAINRFWDQLDRFYESQWKRVKAMKTGGENDLEYEAVEKFREACRMDGVPDEALEKVTVVRAWRSVGAGSAALRKQVLQQFIAMYYPLLRPNGQEALLRDAMAVSSSPSASQRYMPGSDWPGEPTDQESYAALENGIMMVGAPPQIADDQDHIIHAVSHLHSVGQALETLPQGGDQSKVLSYAETAGPHIAQHLQLAGRNPMFKAQVKQLTAMWIQMSQVSKKLEGKVKSDMMAAQQQQAKTQRVMTDEEIAQFEAQSKAQISAMKAQQILQLKAQRQNADIQLKAQKQQADIALKAHELGANIELTDAETAAGIHRDNAQAVADMRRKAATEGKEGAD